jgi:O-antigen/teichoic acid export membrane protein
MFRSHSLAKHLPAGLVDASFASLATFAVGLAAVNLLDDAERGVYAVFFTAFTLGTVVPRNLIFTPAEVEVVALPPDRRVAWLRHTLRLGSLPALVGASSAVLAAAFSASLATASVIVPLAATGAAATVLSPLQDHVRKVLHAGERSWTAATVSVIQFGAAVVALLAMLVLDTPAPWVPFGALGLANLVSLTGGWILTRPDSPEETTAAFAFRSLARRGRWLVVQAAGPSLGGFVAAVMITRLADAEALGFAEAARVVSQPILVLAAGLTLVLNPRAVEAAMNKDKAAANRIGHAYLIGMTGAGALYLAWAAWPWALNPLPHLVPAAYTIEGLVALTIVANMVTASVFLQVNELLGANRERVLARVSWIAVPVLLAGAATASVTHAFARAIGRLGASLTRFGLQQASLRSHYGDSTGSPVAGSSKTQDT